MLLIVRLGAFFLALPDPEKAGKRPFSVDKKFSSTIVHK
jgi:hypothetical protein